MMPGTSLRCIGYASYLDANGEWLPATARAAVGCAHVPRCPGVADMRVTPRSLIEAPPGAALVVVRAGHAAVYHTAPAVRTNSLEPLDVVATEVLADTAAPAMPHDFTRSSARQISPYLRFQETAATVARKGRHLDVHA